MNNYNMVCDTQKDKYEALAKNGYVMGTLRKDEVLVDTGDTYIAIDEVIKSF